MYLHFLCFLFYLFFCTSTLFMGRLSLFFQTPEQLEETQFQTYQQELKLIVINLYRFLIFRINVIKIFVNCYQCSQQDLYCLSKKSCQIFFSYIILAKTSYTYSSNNYILYSLYSHVDILEGGRIKGLATKKKNFFGSSKKRSHKNSP